MYKPRYKGEEIFVLLSFRMGVLPLAVVKVIIWLSTLLTVAAVNDLGYSVEKYDELPGIYYENRGVTVLYNNAWRTVFYFNLNRIANETVILRKYVQHVDALCRMTVIRNWIGCAHSGSDARETLKQLTQTEGLLKEITGQETEGKRKKRGVFNFIDELGKVLFGTMDDDDANYYNEQINCLNKIQKTRTRC